MHVHEAITLFHRWSDNLAQKPHRWTATILLDAMITFYEQVRAIEPDLEQDGDMLLFQWGIYGWNSPKAFRFDFTRQFVFMENQSNEGNEAYSEPVMRQLQVTLLYEPTPFQELKPGNHWCHLPTDVQAFRDWTEQSPAFQLASRYTPYNLEIFFTDPE